MKLKRVENPSYEPVELSEVKEYLRIDDDSLDMTLYSLIIAARDYCESFQNRSFITQNWEIAFDDFPTMPLKLPRPPLRGIESVTLVDELGEIIQLSPSNFILDTYSEPGRISFSKGHSWPSVRLQSMNGVRIRYSAGYGDNPSVVPAVVKQAMLIFIAHRCDNPEDEDVPEVVKKLLSPDRVVPL